MFFKMNLWFLSVALTFFGANAMAAETSTSISTTIVQLWTDMTKFFTGAEGFLLAGLIVLVAGFGIKLVSRVTSKA